MVVEHSILTAGAATALVGVIYALMQHDLKRLLAYHTVENIGIIFIGLGLALAFEAHGMASAAALALTAGLFVTLLGATGLASLHRNDFGTFARHVRHFLKP